jgi:CheY-like chemotaxis protein
MVADDEAPVLELECRLLEMAGYHVLRASHGLDAIALLTEGTALDPLIADVNMPGLNRMELVRRFRATRPDLKVLLVTGHVDRLIEPPRLWDREVFVEKLLTPGSLREAVSFPLYGKDKKPPNG